MGFLFNKPANTTPPAPVPVHPLTREALRLAPDRSLYRLGHSTVLLRLRGGWWLTDPVFSERAFRCSSWDRSAFMPRRFPWPSCRRYAA